MKKKKLVKWLSVAMAAAMVVTATPISVFEASLVKAEEEAARKLQDGVNDAWTQDNVVEGDSFKVEDGWLHYQVSGEAGTRNNPGTNAAMLVNPNTFDFNKDGYISFKFKTNNPNTGTNDSDRFGVYLGYNTDQNGMFVGYDSGGWFWQKYANGSGDWYSGTRAAVPTQGEEYDVRVDWTADHKMTLTLNGAVVFDKEDFSGIVDTLGNKIAFKGGAYGGTGTNVLLKDIHYTGQAEITDPVDPDPIEPEEPGVVETEVLSTEAMDVYVAKNFPSVVKYNMKGDLAGKTFLGQEDAIKTIKINGTAVELSEEDVKATFEGNRAEYVMTVKGNDIDAVITAELVAEANTVAFNITDIKNNLVDAVNGNPIESIEIPNHSLISVNSSQEGANLMGAAMSSNTRTSGDEYVEINANTPIRSRDYMYAFISNNELSAGLWSNSENEGRHVAVGVYGGSHNTRVMAVSEKKDDYVKMGLGSTLWYYHRTEVDSKGVRHMVEETEMPKMKVIITGDMNDDNIIDWNDGAVAFRDIMHNPYKSEEVPELVAWRIAMNFGGQAQNPFLTTLDNVKRVAMHTDGLGQSVLLKGYGNEGHDSGHPDYADIGERIGGAEDMNFLMENGAKYGARFGIHVNAGEMYPEAKAFSEELVRRDVNGNLRYGWNWIDQGVGIDSVYDLAMGLREARFDELKEKVGDNMDFVYVDIWGNRTGGSDDSWQTRKLSKEITDNGWRMTTEWGSANEYDSTFQHWACDLTYGGYELKGENSDVMRFLRNHQKDSWVGDFPSYGGAAMAPLLGGYNMRDFEGWQGRNDYDAYIKNLYARDLTTKFIQHYEIIKWVDGEPVQAGAAANWTPEMEITLKDEDGDILFLERGSNDPSSKAYRDRTMTLNGKVIATGAQTIDERSVSGDRGTEKYLLPWFWDPQTGEKVAADDEKLYHWNTLGGESTWELPDSWADLASVKVYKLTDLGKTEEQTVEVTEGKITLNAEAEIPYVVFRGEKGNLDITWSERMHIVDAGFNTGNDGLAKYWDKAGSGDAVIAKSQYSNPMMKLSGEVAMTQELTDLEAGKQYAVLVGVDNRSDSKASMTIKTGEEVLASNYTVRSIAKNYVKAYTHSNSSATVDGSSYFQHLYVFFTAPADGKVTLTLAKEAGEGDTYFDDVRVVENDSKNITYNEKGQVVKFEQDFENNVQGLYPFVVGGIEGVEDNRIHLSELHAPYTQAGWDVKKMDDVLDGNWSVKINGLTQRNTLAYQTIPQNFRFEPGVTYKVSFDYQAGSDDTYGVVVGSGEYTGATDLETLKKAMGPDADAHYEREVVGDITGQTWIGIYSTGVAPDLQGSTGSAQNFGGYKELVIDNLVIERVEKEITAEDLSALVEEAEAKYEKDKYMAEDWMYLENALADAKVALNRDVVSEDDIEDAYYMLYGAINFMNGIETSEAASPMKDISLEGVTATAGSVDGGTYGSSFGKPEFAIDGDVSTAWMTDFNGYSSTIKNREGWIDLEFPTPHTVDGLRYLPPQSSPGGTFTAITSYEVYVKTEGSDEYEMVASGDDWAADTTWKYVGFEPVENVTNVKLLATKALNSNWWAIAAEINITSEAEAVKQEIPVDKSALEKLVANAKQYTEADFAEGTWAAFTEKLAIAEEVLANEDATNYDVKLALANLADAIAAAEPAKSDKEDLAALIKYAEDAKNDPSYTYLVPKVKTLFEKALTDAIAVRDKASATQAEVDAAYDLLLSRVHLLNFTGNPSSLKELVKVAEGKVKDAYTAESWEPFEKALAAAQAVAADVNALQEEIEAAQTALQEAMDALKEIPVDKTKLIKLVNNAKAYDQTKYTPDTVAALNAAIDGAQGVLDNTQAIQAEVNSAYKTLLSAIFGLREIPNKDKLEGLLAKVKAMDLSAFDAETAKAVKAAYASAVAVFENENADQKQVDAAVKALEEAITAANADDGSAAGDAEEEKVVSKDKKSDAKKASTGSATKTNTTSNTSKAAKTGDEGTFALWGMMMAAVLAGIMAFTKRRRQG